MAVKKSSKAKSTSREVVRKKRTVRKKLTSVQQIVPAAPVEVSSAPSQLSSESPSEPSSSEIVSQPQTQPTPQPEIPSQSPPQMPPASVVNPSPIEQSTSSGQPAPSDGLGVDTTNQSIPQSAYQPVATPADTSSAQIPSGSQVASLPPSTDINAQINQSTTVEDPKASTSHKKKFLLIGLFLLVGIILGTVLMIFRQKMIGQYAKKVQPIVATKVQKQISPTVEPTLAVSKFPIKILNGSGIAGEASRMKELLISKGFTISDTGNADVYTYKETVIQPKKDTSKEFIKKLKEALEKTYALSETSSLSTDSAGMDVVIIVGSKKAQ